MTLRRRLRPALAGSASAEVITASPGQRLDPCAGPAAGLVDAAAYPYARGWGQILALGVVF
jgi:hypothetical protein